MKTVIRNFTTYLLSGVLLFHLSLSAQEKPLKDFQLSFLPMVSTDGTDVINYRYKTSINLFAGINGGLQGVELGGFMNINKGMAEGLQLAGFGNIVSGNFEGFQGAGFMNIVTGHAKGFQGSGFINVIRGGNQGFLGSGFMNVVNGDSQSISGAGFMNVVHGNHQGLSGSGFMNVTSGNFNGLQGTGFMNVTRGYSMGLSGAGFANISGGKYMGIQAAGFMNVAQDMDGIQAAGFLNVARNVSGLQLGFINVADTVAGIPIGFLSIVRKGALREIELSANDVFLMNASFRIGVPVFYNIFSVGYRPVQDTEFFAMGYGIGSRLELSDDLNLDIELHSSQLHAEWNWDWWSENHWSRLNELRALFTLEMGQAVQLFAGPVLYNHYFRISDEYGREDLEIAPYNIYEYTSGNRVRQWWAGGKAGLRFVLP
ncbi:MAG: hypothetical protein ABR597_05695 [Bacteroidales bacterium]